MSSKKLPDNFVVIDLETSGLDPAECGILEIGAVTARGWHFYRRVKLARGRRIDWAALQCNGIDALNLGEGVDVETAIGDLLAWLRNRNQSRSKKYILGGKNPKFDYDFLEANWPEQLPYNITDVISRRLIDLHQLVYARAINWDIDTAADDFCHDEIYLDLGIDLEPMPHNALRGALHELHAFSKIVKDEKLSIGSHPYMIETMDRDWVQTASKPDIDNNNYIKLKS